MSKKIHTLVAGAAETDITPLHSVHLAGYPFVARNSTGTHDPLLSTALYISDNENPVIFIGNDVIFVGRDSVDRVRNEVAQKTGVPATNILVSATHTHSGPVTVRFTAGGHDALLPEPDAAYLQQMEAGMIDAACKAVENAANAIIGLSIANATGIGSNRRDRNGLSDLDVPVLAVRAAESHRLIALMLVCNMHPTVLHEDSTLFSGDFPGLARQVLQKELLPSSCPVVYHAGACGNQSPRYVVRENNFPEAERLGRILAKAVAGAIKKIEYRSDISTRVQQHMITLPRKKFPAKAVANEQVKERKSLLARLKMQSATRHEVRSAEVNWFGAIELAYLCELSQSNALDAVYEACLPAEIQLVRIGDWCFVGWPGEIFIEYALQLKEKYSNVFVITMANGELQGYIVTKEAAEAGGYEASNAIFDYSSGELLVTTTLRLLEN